MRLKHQIVWAMILITLNVSAQTKYDTLMRNYIKTAGIKWPIQSQKFNDQLQQLSIPGVRIYAGDATFSLPLLLVYRETTVTDSVIILNFQLGNYFRGFYHAYRMNSDMLFTLLNEGQLYGDNVLDKLSSYAAFIHGSSTSRILLNIHLEDDREISVRFGQPILLWDERIVIDWSFHGNDRFRPCSLFSGGFSVNEKYHLQEARLLTDVFVNILTDWYSEKCYAKKTDTEIILSKIKNVIRSESNLISYELIEISVKEFSAVNGMARYNISVTGSFVTRDGDGNFPPENVMRQDGFDMDRYVPNGLANFKTRLISETQKRMMR
jgi:hypothetical protein